MRTHKPKVLSFIDWYKPGYKAGGTVTAFSNFVAHLEESFDFKIVTRDCDYFEEEPYQNIRSDTWVQKSKTAVYYVSKTNENFRKIMSIMKASSADWIYINGVFSFYFSIIPVLLIAEKSCIVNPHGMLSEQAFSVKSFKKNIFLKLANLFSIYKNVIFHVANQNEKEAVIKRIKRYRGIKVVNQLPKKVIFDPAIKGVSKNLISKFVSITRISKEKGILKMIKAFQKVKLPLEFDIFGPVYDESYWELCKAEIKKLPANVTFNYRGSMHADVVLQTLKKYDYFILLSEGENFGHAILEALSVGLPIIISDKTPWIHLEEKGLGHDVPIESEAIPKIIEGFCEMKNSDYRKMSDKCYKFAKDFSEDSKSLEANKNIFY